MIKHEKLFLSIYHSSIVYSALSINLSKHFSNEYLKCLCVDELFVIPPLSEQLLPPAYHGIVLVNISSHLWQEYYTVHRTPHAGIWGAWHASGVRTVHPATSYGGYVKISNFSVCYSMSEPLKSNRY